MFYRKLRKINLVYIFKILFLNSYSTNNILIISSAKIIDNSLKHDCIFIAYLYFTIQINFNFIFFLYFIYLLDSIILAYVQNNTVAKS